MSRSVYSQPLRKILEQLDARQPIAPLLGNLFSAVVRAGESAADGGGGVGAGAEVGADRAPSRKVLV